MCRKVLLSVIFVFIFFNSVYAESSELVPYKKHSVYGMWENDKISFIHTDRNYTNGVRYGYTSKEYDYFKEDNRMSWAKNISVINYNKPHITRFHISINQEMYTPEHMRNITLINEHAYGGFLYLNAGIYNRTENTLEHIGIKTGVTGPYSFAEEAQFFIHKMFNKGIFYGWERQVGTEFIFNPYYQWTGRAYIFKTKYISMDFLGTFDIAAGNADTHFGAYGTIRIGHNLDNDFGVQKINALSDAAPVHSDKFSFYFFAGGGPRIVLYNLFIAGNNSTSDLGYNTNMLRWDAECGVVISYYGVRVGYSWTYYTKEYTSQPYNHSYGNLFIEISF